MFRTVAQARRAAGAHVPVELCHGATKGGGFVAPRIRFVQRRSSSKPCALLLSSFFLRSIKTTWDDPAVFQSLDGTPEFWQKQKLDKIPAKLSRRHSWSFTQGAPVPRGTVVLKRNKQFSNGRTIISYAGSLCSKLLLLQLAPIVLSLIMKRLCPDSPGMQSMPQLWKSLHSYWVKPTGQYDKEWNDDLVGFFNAVPRKDILQEVIDITEE